MEIPAFPCYPDQLCSVSSVDTFPSHPQSHPSLRTMYSSTFHGIPENSLKEPYFAGLSISTPGRQRTAQACDKCRERKTKCSGERPVCQRCVSRGLVCEYSYREPRVRGPTRSRMLSTLAAPSCRDSPIKAFHFPSISYQEPGYPRVRLSRINEYGTDNYGQPCGTPLALPRWTDARHTFGYASSLGVMSDSVCLGYDPYQPPPQQPQWKHEHDSSYESTSVSSGFSFGIQEVSQHGGRINYDYGLTTASERQSSSSPESREDYHDSGSALGSLASTPSCCPSGPADNFPLNKHNATVAGNYRGYNRHGFEADGNLLNFPYGTREVGIRDDWSMGLDNRVLGAAGSKVNEGPSKQQMEKFLGTLWQNGVRPGGLEVDFPCQTQTTHSVPCT